jgi:hypothetical protein
MAARRKSKSHKAARPRSTERRSVPRASERERGGPSAPAAGRSAARERKAGGEAPSRPTAAEPVSSVVYTDPVRAAMERLRMSRLRR